MRRANTEHAFYNEPGFRRLDANVAEVSKASGSSRPVGQRACARSETVRKEYSERATALTHEQWRAGAMSAG